MPGLKSKLLLIFAFFIAVLTPLETFEKLSYDHKMSLRAELHQFNSPVIIIDIDDSTIQKIGNWPWPRQKISDLIETLKDHYATEAIGLNFIFPQKTTKFDDSLILNKLNQPFITSGIILDKNNSYKMGMIPESSLYESIVFNHARGWLGVFETNPLQIVGHLNTPQDSDGKVRRIPSQIKVKSHQYSPFAYALLYSALGGKYNSDTWESIIERAFENQQILIPYDFNLNDVPVFPAKAIFNKTVDKALLQGNIILIGSSSPGIGSQIATPIHNNLPGVALHTYLIDAALNDRWLSLLNRNDEIQILGMILATIVTAMLWGKIRFTYIITLQLIAIILITYLNYIDFVYNGLVWEITPWWLYFSLQIMIILLVSYIRYSQKNKYVEKLFASYVPKNIVHKLVSGDVAKINAGERKKITIIFADLVNFTPLAESIEPEELTLITRKIFNQLTKIILDNQGTIDKYMGDSIMAFWGAPLENNKQAELAVKSAIEITIAAEKFPHNIQIGVGINTGEAVVGNVGSDFRHTYSALGDAVNVAARLEAQTREHKFQILLSETTAVECKYAVKFVDKIKLKGKSSWVNIYTLS